MVTSGVSSSAATALWSRLQPIAEVRAERQDRLPDGAHPAGHGVGVQYVGSG